MKQVEMVHEDTRSETDTDTSDTLQIPALIATGLDFTENHPSVFAKFAVKEKEFEVLQISQGKLLLLSITWLTRPMTDWDYPQLQSQATPPSAFPCHSRVNNSTGRTISVPQPAHKHHPKPTAA